MVSEYDKKHLSNAEIGRINAIDASVKSGKMSTKDGHGLVEEIRKGYGYSGGTDGSQYIKLDSGAAKGSGFDSSALISTLTSGNKWQKSLESAAKGYLGMSYDDFTNSDDYASLAKRYSDSGQKAMQNTLGEVSARTGGLASSYATTASQQSYNEFMANLEDAARSMYQSERSDAAANVSALQSLYDGEESSKQALANWAYQLGRDKVSDARYADETAYNREQTDKQWAYQTESDDYAKALAKAETLAAYGDFSGYKALGYADEEIAALQKGYNDAAAAATAAASYSGGSGGSSLSLSQALSEAKAGRLSETGKEVVDATFGDGYYENNFVSGGSDYDEITNLAYLMLGADDGTGSSVYDVANMLNEAKYSKLIEEDDIKLIINRMEADGTITPIGKKMLEKKVLGGGDEQD